MCQWSHWSTSQEADRWGSLVSWVQEKKKKKKNKNKGKGFGYWAQIGIRPARFGPTCLQELCTIQLGGVTGCISDHKDRRSFFFLWSLGPMRQRVAVVLSWR